MLYSFSSGPTSEQEILIYPPIALIVLFIVPMQANLTPRAHGGPILNRRSFLRGIAVPLIAAGGTPWGSSLAAVSKPQVQTVRGKIPASDLGLALPHEHVLCDFIGADKTSRNRWDPPSVVRRMAPYLRQLRDRGVSGFVDCTPAFIGRDPRILKLLSEETGLHILTNTGYYGGAGDKFVPRHAFDESAEQLALRWMKEAESGIEDTGVLPGFIKIGVDEATGDPPRLSEIDAKLVRAASLTSQKSQLTVTCHTGGGPAGLAAAKLFIAQGGAPRRFIVAHSDGHGLPINEEVAGLGAWVSYDGISRLPLQQHLKLVMSMVNRYASRLLLSQDNGWYWVGQADGGEVREFNYLTDTFLPALSKAGVDEKTIQQLVRSNPQMAFGSGE